MKWSFLLQNGVLFLQNGQTRKGNVAVLQKMQLTQKFSDTKLSGVSLL